MTRRLLTGAAILADGAFLHDHAVLVDGATIDGLVPDTARVDAARVQLPAGSLLAPGLIDVQVNGGGGLLFNAAPTRDAALAIAAAHRRLGTTAILPTLITDTPAAMRQAADAVLQAAGPDSPILGIHFEGPFLSPDKPGIHQPGLIRSPDEADLVMLEALARDLPGKILLTLAPEAVGDAALRRLAASGVVLSAGHTEASLERCDQAIAAGLTGFTHLFNAMPAPAARAPGPVAAALLHPDCWCGVIADGVHVHPAMLRLLLASRPAGRVVLVSDAMPPVGTDATGFTLQGRRILRGGGRLTAEDGTLAGADICLADAVRTLTRTLGVPAAHALSMAAASPAAFLGLDRLGRVQAGCRADLVLLTPELEVLGTWLAGAWAGAPGVLTERAA